METKKDKIFVAGMRIERPLPGAPEFVKGKISIKVEELIPFLEQYKSEKGWVNIDLKVSKDGRLYLELNTFIKKVSGEEINAKDIPI